jgi:hypothetical protein
MARTLFVSLGTLVLGFTTLAAMAAQAGCHVA